MAYLLLIMVGYSSLDKVPVIDYGSERVKIVRQAVYWINLAHDGDQWWALMNTVMDLQVP
jgi:hypothetical protein